MKLRLALAGGAAALALAACTPQQIAQYGNAQAVQTAKDHPRAGFTYYTNVRPSTDPSGATCHVQIYRDQPNGMVFDGDSPDLCRTDVVDGINVGDFTVTCWKVMGSGQLIQFRADAQRVAQSGCDAMSSDDQVNAA